MLRFLICNDYPDKFNTCFLTIIYNKKAIFALNPHLPFILLEKCSVWHGVEQRPETCVTTAVVEVVEKFSRKVHRNNLFIKKIM